MKTTLLRALVPALLLAVSGLAHAQTPAANPLPEAVVAYSKILTAVERSDAPTSLEPLFEAGDEAQGALMRIERDKAWLEQLSEAEFAAAQTAMRGFTLSTGSDIYALPNASFFADLAKLHGKPEDIAFFALTKQAAGENFLPLYLKDKLPTPCVRFGERIISELYEGWKGYAKTWPKAYTAAVRQNLKDLEETVVLGTCACGNAASVQAEQREFLRRFPKNAVAKDIVKRMKQLQTDDEVQPVNCR